MEELCIVDKKKQRFFLFFFPIILISSESKYLYVKKPTESNCLIGTVGHSQQ